jgi:hypothetical protein
VTASFDCHEPGSGNACSGPGRRPPALEGLEERRAIEAEGGYEPSIQGDPTTHSGASQDQTQNPLRWRPANSNTEALPHGVADHDGAVDARLSSSTA